MLQNTANLIPATDVDGGQKRNGGLDDRGQVNVILLHQRGSGGSEATAGEFGGIVGAEDAGLGQGIDGKV